MDALNDIKSRMAKVLDHLNADLRTVRTGRAHPGIVEDIIVEAYGNQTPIKGLASISTPEPRTIMISPWDKGVASAIEKALKESDLSINPVVTGTDIKVQLPELTAERREELVKFISSKAEESKVSLRNIREEYLKLIKQAVADKEASEDELERSKKEIQALIDEMQGQIEQSVDTKTEEVRTI